MADNIQFLRGSQAKLGTLTTFTEGAFYLTTDTERLYYAKTSSDLAYLNKYITTVDYVSTTSEGYTSGSTVLPSATAVNKEDFYYVRNGNILCFSNGTQWVQVNAQPEVPEDTDTKVESFTIAETAADATGITFTYTLSQADKAGNTVGTNISNTFKIEKADINALVDHPVIKVGLSATQITNGAKISTIGNGSDNTEIINIKGGDNVTVTVNGDDITISAKDTNIYPTAVEADAEGKIAITLNDGNKVTSKPDLFYKINGKNLLNQDDLGAEVETLIQNKLTSIVNVMTFKGNIDSKDNLPAKPAIGDVYIITGSSVEVNTGEYAYHGDMIIANGVETNGVITSGLTWIVVDGEEENTTYTLKANDNTITLKEDDGSVVSTLTLNDDDVVILTSANDTITATHKTYTAKNTEDMVAEEAALNHEGTFTAVTGFVSDSHGHVTEVNTTKFTLPTDNDTQYQLSGATLGTIDNGVSITDTLQDKSGHAAGTSVFNIVSTNTTNLQVSASGANVQLSLVWGEF